ncbi:MAG: single-stranded DNA-binding protein [Clostridia bacterium]|nr:single-stranded DNA-binding protein [Clostridia bacterium]
MNKVILMGRLTKDPDVRYTQTNNTLVASFSLAVNRRFARQGEERQADFFNVVAWNKTGEFVSKYFKKGQQVGVIGRLQTRSYDDAQGQKRYVTEVIAEETYFADSKRDGEASTSADFADTFGENLAQTADFQVDATDDDLPF